MKKYFIIICFCLSASTGHAQFAQMLQTMLQQIAALESYLKVAEKGYQITEDGWHMIKDIKNGEFNLHSIFFASLKKVNPTVSRLAEVSEIIGIQISIADKAGSTLSRVRQNKWLQPSEISYLINMLNIIITQSLQDLNSLSDLTTDGKLEMTDGDRIKAIQQIDANMQSRYGILRSVSDQSDMLADRRANDYYNTESIKKLYGF